MVERHVDALPNNLPRELTSFIGREDELAAVRGALRETRLLTLTGAGGCGKTRLALAVAVNVPDRFPDGAWWVELAPLADPAHVGIAVADAVGVRPLPRQSALDAALAHLASRRVLLVLDNCEHLLPATADAALALVGGCPEATVLVTSRAPLGVGAETTWRVPSLSVPEEGATQSAGPLVRTDAVRLFAERAAKVRTDFELTGANASAVARICRELDGIPLAIELAAARVRLLSVEQIATGLSDRFRLLTGGPRSGLPRHRTLRASVDWSHELLSEQERVLFRRLAVFAGRFTLEAIEAVAALHESERAAALDVLAALVDKSLVIAEQNGRAARYRLLETIRAYALERLREAGELDALRDRHLDWFVTFAETQGEGLPMGGVHLGTLDKDAPNLSAALDRAIGTDVERALRMCAALTPWWKVRGMLLPGEAASARALAAPGPAPSALRARVLWGRGYLLAFAGRVEEAVRTLEQAREVAEAGEDAVTTARTLVVLGIMRHPWDPAGARPLQQRARKLARASGDKYCYVNATHALGWSHVITEDFDEADRLFEEGLTIAERLEYDEGIAWCCAGMGFRQMAAAEGERLFELAGRAVAAARRVGEPVSEGVAHSLMARLELAQGRVDAALERLTSSRERLIATGGGMALPGAESILAGARTALGDADEAVAALQPVVASGGDFGWQLAWATLYLAEALHAVGDAAGADEQARHALEVSERIQSGMCTAWSKEVLGRLAASRAEWKSAEALLHEALALRAERGLRLWLPQTLDTLAEVAAGLASHEEAARLLGAVDRARSDLGLVRWPPDDARFEAVTQELRAALGGAAFTAAWREGAGLALEEAVAWVRRARGSRKRPPGGWESLTPTELEVARHVTRGLTNPQIGAAMFISRGTVKSHLSHIYAKLGMHNRAQLTAEATRRLPPSPR